MSKKISAGGDAVDVEMVDAGVEREIVGVLHDAECEAIPLSVSGVVVKACVRTCSASMCPKSTGTKSITSGSSIMRRTKTPSSNSNQSW